MTKDKMRNKKTARRCRGLAEIEALFCIFVLMGVMMVSWGMAKLGLARINAVEDAMRKVMVDSQTAAVPQYAGDARLPEVTTEWDIRPGLPNRSHVATTETTMTINVGNLEPAGPFTPSGTAGAISPAWMMSAYPDTGDDAGPTQQWFEEFVQESHIELQPSLMLAPDWRP